MKQPIKDWKGIILGYIEEKPNGDKIIYDFYGRIKGKYLKSINTTTDFYGRKIAQGDQSAMLINMK